MRLAIKKYSMHGANIELKDEMMSKQIQEAIPDWEWMTEEQKAKQIADSKAAHRIARGK